VRMKGWVGLVGWPTADGLPIWMVTHQLQVRCRPLKVRMSETDVLPLSHPTNHRLPVRRSNIQAALSLRFPHRTIKRTWYPFLTLSITLNYWLISRTRSCQMGGHCLCVCDYVCVSDCRTVKPKRLKLKSPTESVSCLKICNSYPSRNVLYLHSASFSWVMSENDLVGWCLKGCVERDIQVGNWLKLGFHNPSWRPELTGDQFPLAEVTGNSGR